MAKADVIPSFGKYGEAESQVSKITEDELKIDDELKIVVARDGSVTQKNETMLAGSVTQKNETTGRSPIE